MNMSRFYIFPLPLSCKTAGVTTGTVGTAGATSYQDGASDSSIDFELDGCESTAIAAQASDSTGSAWAALIKLRTVVSKQPAKGHLEMERPLVSTDVSLNCCCIEGFRCRSAPRTRAVDARS